MVKLTIDGKTIEVTEGTTVLRAAEQAGVFIPTLCDHPHLSPYGGCRLCLVEVEGFRTLQPSCTLPATNNMVIHTDTPKVHAARKLVLSLIFSERNHFCPYCQVSGGDCELQNNAYLEGMTHWPIQPNWQSYEVDASHPYIIIEHNRCILCRRCVRACGELVGNYTLGFAERGAASILIADLGGPLGESTCVSCGMCVQVCPTGAIIDRSSAYQGLENDVERINTVCQGCSVGCGITVVVRNNRILRIEGNWDAPINHGLTCEIGRYKPLYDDRKRIETPLIRKSGKLVPTTWEEALADVARHFKQTEYSAIASSRLSVEALHAFGQMFIGHAGILEVNPILPAQSDVFEGNLSELDKADCFIVVGTDLSENQQVAGFMVKRAVQAGAELVVVDSGSNSFDGITGNSLKGGEIAPVLQGLAASLVKLGLNKAPSTIKPWDILGTLTAKTGIEVEAIMAAAQVIGSASHTAIIYGEGAIQSSEFANALMELARISGALDDNHSGVVSVKGTANALAASLLGLKSNATLPGACYIAIGDSEVSDESDKSLQGFSYLAVQASFASAITERADVVLPAAIWAEEIGHFINMEGAVQQSALVLKAAPGIKSNAEIFTALAEKMGTQLTTDWQSPIHAVKSPVALHQ